MKSLFCLLVVLFCAQSYAEPETNAPADNVVWKEQSAPYFNDKVEIKVSNPAIREGEIFDLDVCFTNGEDKRALFPNTVFFNPFLQHQENMRPATLALFDEKHKLVRNLRTSTGGSGTPITADDWSYIPTGGYVGTHMQVSVSHIGLPSALYTFPEGTYYLQLIYNESFVAPRPQSGQELAVFRAHGKWNELFRSNVVKITVASSVF